MADKRVLRARMRARRDAFVADDPPPCDAPPPFLDRLRPQITIAAYRPIGSEADPAALVAAALACGCRLALPHVTDRSAPMRFLAWQPDDVLEPGPFGLQQPDPARPLVSPDMILTPLVAFDPGFNRLGQGAGHYDRAFAALPDALRIGVAWSIQLTDMLPTDPWDQPLHAVVTEQGWMTPEATP